MLSFPFILFHDELNLLTKHHHHSRHVGFYGLFMQIVTLPAFEWTLYTMPLVYSTAELSQGSVYRPNSYAQS